MEKIVIDGDEIVVRTTERTIDLGIAGKHGVVDDGEIGSKLKIFLFSKRQDGLSSSHGLGREDIEKLNSSRN